MNKIFFIALIAFSCLRTDKVFADTVDVWTIKLNGKLVANSNQVAICLGYPMKLNLAGFTDDDQLEICFWTDTGREKNQWYYLFKGQSGIDLARFANEIDTTIQSSWTQRKNYISFTVKQLKAFISGNKLSELNMEFEYGDTATLNPYYKRPICIFTNK